jgi:hypothetical protein
MKRKIQKIIDTGKVGLSALGLGALSLFAPVKTNAQESNINANAEVIRANPNRLSSVRANAFYELPGNVNSYTFADFYSDGDSFFGKSIHDRELIGRINAACEVAFGNGFPNRYSLGVSLNLPTPEGSFSSLKYLPLSANKEGIIRDTSIIGYTAGASLPLGLDLFSFGDHSIERGKFKWGYSEVDITKPIGRNLELGVRGIFTGNGTSKPDAHAGAFLRFKIDSTKN